MLAKTYAFLNHARDSDPQNVVSLIETGMGQLCAPAVLGISLADVIFLHFPTHEIEPLLDDLIDSTEVTADSTIVLCSSHPFGMGSVLTRPTLQKFPKRHVLGDPYVFLGVIDEFLTSLAAGKVRTDLLASRAPPEALVGLYLLLKGGMDDASIESYRAANGEKLRSEAKVYLREGLKIETIDSNALSQALARAFER